jgi:hypothetical protein
MLAYTNQRKTTSVKGNSGRKSALAERDRHTLRRIILKNHRITAAQVTAELNIHLEEPVPTKTVQPKLHRSNIHVKTVIVKPLISESNAQMHKQWCRNHRTTGNAHLIWSDEPPFTLFRTSGRVYVSRTHKEAYHLECLAPTVKEGGGFVMVWAAISWCSVGPITTLHG